MPDTNRYVCTCLAAWHTGKRCRWLWSSVSNGPEDGAGLQLALGRLHIAA